MQVDQRQSPSVLAPQNSPKQHGLPTGPCVQYEVSSQESVYTFWEKRWKLAAPPFIFPFIFHSSSTMSLPTISDHNDIVLSPFATLVITTHGNKTPLQSSGCFFFLQRLSLLNTGTDTDGGESFFFRHFNAYNASSTETQSTILGDNCNKVLFMCEATNLPYFTYAKLCSSPKTHSLFLG